MYRTILIPTDFSARSREALRFVAENLSGLPSRFILLNAYANMPPTSAPMITINDILKRRSEEGLQREVDYLLSILGPEQTQVTRVSRAENLKKAIQEVVAREKVGMIVLGLDGEELDHKELSESVKTPVLLVPRKTKEKSQ